MIFFLFTAKNTAPVGQAVFLYFERGMIMGFFSSNASVKELKQLLKNCNPNISDGLVYSDNPVKKLAEVLLPNEKIEYAVRDIAVLAVCTDKRFICLTAKNTLSTDVADVSYSKISSVKIDSGIGNDELEVFMSGSKIKVKYTGKERAKQMYGYLQEKLNDGSKTETKNNVSNDTLSQLERLGSLRAQGILTEEEFSLQKQRILGNTSQDHPQSNCLNCGTKVSPDWKFCPSCTNPL